MKIKLNDEVVWLGKKCTVTAIKPQPFAFLALTGSDGIEEYVLNNHIQAFINENSKEAKP